MPSDVLQGGLPAGVGHSSALVSTGHFSTTRSACCFVPGGALLLSASREAGVLPLCNWRTWSTKYGPTGGAGRGMKRLVVGRGPQMALKSAAVAAAGDPIGVIQQILSWPPLAAAAKVIQDGAPMFKFGGMKLIVFLEDCAAILLSVMEDLLSLAPIAIAPLLAILVVSIVGMLLNMLLRIFHSLVLRVVAVLAKTRLPSLGDGRNEPRQLQQRQGTARQGTAASPAGASDSTWEKWKRGGAQPTETQQAARPAPSASAAVSLRVDAPRGSAAAGAASPSGTTTFSTRAKSTGTPPGPPAASAIKAGKVGRVKSADGDAPWGGSLREMLASGGVVPGGNARSSPALRPAALEPPATTVQARTVPAEIERQGGGAALSSAGEGAGSAGRAGGCAAGAQWSLVTDGGQEKGMMVLRNAATGTTLELPLAGLGVLFAAQGTGVVSRCWGDGTIYERFSFRSDEALVQGAAASAARRVSEVPSGGALGQWAVEAGDAAVSLFAAGASDEVHPPAACLHMRACAHTCAGVPPRDRQP